MKRAMCRALALLLAALWLPALPALADWGAIRGSLAKVYAEGDDPVTGGQGAWIGTAFAVGDGGSTARYFVTSRHVVSGALVLWIVCDTPENRVPCNVKAVSSRCDLALLEVDTRDGVPCAPAALRPFDASALERETVRVWSCGFPAFVMGDKSTSTRDLLMADLVVIDGTVSRVLSHDETQAGEMLAHSAGMGGGSSGGALVDQDGRVLGVSTQWLPADGDGYLGCGFAISSNEVLRLLEDAGIAAGAGEAPRGFVGR